MPVSPDRATKTFAALIRESGLRPVRLHDLRHGAASLMLAADVELAVISKRLGHSSLAITAGTYSHLLEGVGASAAEKAAALVPRANRRDQSVTSPRNRDLLDPLEGGVPAGQAMGPAGLEPTIYGVVSAGACRTGYRPLTCTHSYGRLWLTAVLLSTM